MARRTKKDNRIEREISGVVSEPSRIYKKYEKVQITQTESGQKIAPPELASIFNVRNRRPAAHNPMIFRKVAKPAGHLCARPGCGGFVRDGEQCQVCAMDQDLAVLDALRIGYPED